ncbi:MAG TPA: hypothetical protein VH593_28585, partial [Ktedonobacteraceae bacterium]
CVLASQLRSLCHLLQPGHVCSDLSGSFAIKVFDIGPDVFIVGFPLVKMTQEQVMISPFSLAQSDQVLRIKLQLRMKVEGFDMMNLQFFPLVTTGHANWLAA